MLLSDQDLTGEITAGNLRLDPFERELLQPSSIDVRLDRLFRVFNNHLYTHIDPATRQDDLTALVEVTDGDPFVLHPGEFVLASTLEVITLGDQLAGRLEGKALAVDTDVPTPDGWRTMADLAAGDVVFDQTGRPTAIVAATPPLVGRDCFEVGFSDGTSIVADASHQWLTRTKSERKHRKPPQVRTTREIAETVRVRDEWNHQLPLADAVEYGVRDLPIDPYVLGVLLADGTSTTAEVTCAPEDDEILDQIRAAGYPVRRANNRMAFRIGGTGRTRDPETGRFRRNSSFSSALRNLGLLGNKHVPEIYLCAGPYQRLALLQGLMDSDGHCDQLGRCEFVSIREGLSLAVAELASSLGLRPRVGKKRVTLNGIEQAPAYQVKFVPHLPVFRLKRKLARQKEPRAHISKMVVWEAYERVKANKGAAGVDEQSIAEFDEDRQAFRAIVSVRPVPSRPVRCIEVASPTGMFLVSRRYIPTHNSSLGRLGLLTHSTAGFIDPGFSGHVTLELSNVATLPIKLWPGMKIGQLCIFRLSSPAENPYGSAVYGSRYQGQRGPTPSRSWQSWRTWPTRPGSPNLG